MFKQLFKNAFNPKESKFGFNLEFINGTLNHNPINKIKTGKCNLNFENQTMIIKQNDNVLIEKMSDIKSIRTWTFKENIYFAIETNTHNEYKFSFETVDFWLKSIEKYSKAFDITFEYCGESETNDSNENDYN